MNLSQAKKLNKGDVLRLVKNPHFDTALRFGDMCYFEQVMQDGRVQVTFKIGKQDANETLDPDCLSIGTEDELGVFDLGESDMPLFAGDLDF